MQTLGKTDQRSAELPDETERFMRLVGKRVRQARQTLRLSRRQLSEASGVSQRYLAQIESGGGNISINLLQRVAIALNTPVANFLGEGDYPVSSDEEFSRLFAGATPDARKKALEVLRNSDARTNRQERICLTGLRGAGKSTIGPLLAGELNFPFLELNAVIEEQAGIPVDEIMALYGQEGYRRLERQSLEVIVRTYPKIILAVAGGIVSESETYEHLLKYFHSIWLRALPEEHMSRVRDQGDERPMAGNPKAMDDLKSILTGREALYERADGQVMTSGKSIEETLAATRKLVDGLAIE